MRIDKELIGQRIIIRNYEKSDLNFLTDMWFDEENGKYMSDPTAEYVDEVYQKALDTLGESKYGYYLLIALADTMESIGSFCIFPDEDKKVYDIGYCIHRNYWRSGYGSEAVSLVLDWLSEQGANKVTAEVAVENAASNALLQKFGFAVEKKTEFKKYNMDVRFDSYIYAKTLARTDNVIIRKAIPGDEQVLAYIQTESWKAAFAGILSPEELVRCTNLQKAEQMYHGVLRREGCNMAIELVNDHPHCIAAWGTNRCDLGNAVGELICIHSLQNNWAKGYGSAMMEFVLAQLQQANYESVILWVFEENTRARKFYEKHGFELTEQKKLANGISELMYMKNF